MRDPLPKDEIVKISASMARYYGPDARMLLPCPATVEAVIKKVPANQLITIDLLREKLAAQFGVETTCPFNTKLCLATIANRPNTKTAYWRVVRANGELLPYFPQGVKGHAAKLKTEGFAIDTKSKALKVKYLSGKLVEL